MKRTVGILLASIMAPLVGCSAGRAPNQAGTLPVAPKPRLAKKATPTDSLRHTRYWKSELRNLRTIPALWNAINRHHDSLGRALAQLPPDRRTYRVVRPRPPGARPVERPRPREVPPRAAPRDRWAQRHSTRIQPVCRRVCRHVRAICYAANRICQIADRLAEWPALQACRRSRARCLDARQAARRRCTRCSR